MNRNNISNEHLLLINILNTLYNDNNRQIQNLNEQNNRIINLITDILYNPGLSNRQNNSQQTNNRYSRNTNTNSNTNNFDRLFLNRQYISENPRNYSVHSTGIEGRVTGIEGRVTGNHRTSAARDAARDTVTQPERLSGVFSNLFQSFFDPVLIYPTASQIDTATRNVLYRDIVSPINNSCPISMDTFNDNQTVTIIRHCGHIFNTNEINTWFRSNCKCPVCRYDIRNYNPTNENSNSQNNIPSQEQISSQPTTTNEQNTSSESVEERRNINILNLLYDISGNILLEEFDPNLFINLINRT